MAQQEPEPNCESSRQEDSFVEENTFEPLLNTAQAADLLGGMHLKTLMQMARKRRLPAHKIGRFWYFRASELNDWLNSSCTGYRSRLQSSHRPCLV